MSDLVLRGEVVDPVDSDLLRRRIQRLESELRDAQKEARDARAEVRQVRESLDAIERYLEPFYRGLRGLFEKFEAASVGAESPSTGQSNAKWESWKQRLPGKAAEFIDLLLLHGEMSAANLKAAAHCSSDTVYQTIYKLNSAGILTKNGGRFSLKQN